MNNSNTKSATIGEIVSAKGKSEENLTRRILRGLV